MIEYLSKTKARTVFSGMIYITWCIAIMLNMITGKVIPDVLNTLVMAQMAFYFGSKGIKK